VFNVLCDLLTGECTTQPALRATSGSVCVDFELGRQLQRCYCSFVVPEICEVPAPLAEGNQLSSVVLKSKKNDGECKRQILEINVSCLFDRVKQPFHR